MRKISLLSFLFIVLFSCEKPADEEPIELNALGEGFCIADEFGNCDPGLGDPGGGGGGSTGGGNTGGGSSGGGGGLPSGNYITYVHKGDATDRIWHQNTTDNGSNWSPNLDIVITTSSGGTTTPETSKEPAVTYDDNKLFVYYKGKSTDRIFYAARDNNGDWEGNLWVNGPSSIETSEAPSAVTLGGVVYLAYKEKNSNRIVVRTASDGINFGQAYVLSTANSALKAPFITKSPNGNLHVFITAGVGVSQSTYLPSDFTGDPSSFTINSDGVGAISDVGTAVSAEFINNFEFVLAYGNNQSEKVVKVWRGNTGLTGTEYVVTNAKTDQRPAVKWIGNSAMVTYKEFLQSQNNVIEDEDIVTKFSSPLNMNFWSGGDSGGNSTGGGVQATRYSIN